MRHTLLPEKEKKNLLKEYRVRLLIVSCFLLSSAGMAGMVSLLPSWSRTLGERRLAETMSGSLKMERQDDLNEMQREMLKSQALLDSLKEIPDEYDLSSVIGGVLGMRGNVKISTISAARSSTSTITFIVGGIAPTRESLLSLKSRFESASIGNKVDLPISQLSKSANIPFSMRLTAQIK